MTKKTYAKVGAAGQGFSKLTKTYAKFGAVDQTRRTLRRLTAISSLHAENALTASPFLWCATLTPLETERRRATSSHRL